MKEKEMKLGEALALLKSKKSEIAKLQNLRSDYFYAHEGKKASFDYGTLTERIGDLSGDIVALKKAVMDANMSKEVVGGGMTLFEAICRIGEMRSDLDNLEKIIGSGRKERSYLFSEDREDDRVPQVPLEEIEKEVRRISYEKQRLDSMLQDSNWKHTVSVPLRLI